VCQDLSHRGHCVADMCVAVFGFYGGRRCHKSVCALFRGVCRLLRGVRSSACRHVVAGFLAAFPFTSLSPLLHCRARARGSGRYVVGRRRLFVCLRMHLFSLAYFMMSLYLILTVKMLLFTLVFRYATAANLGIMYTH